MDTVRFPIRVDRRLAWILLAWGVRAGNAWVELDDESMTARFGRFSMSTPLANIASWRIEGPFRVLTAIGVRGSIRQGDITFGGSAHGGVRMDFREPIRFWARDCTALYVSADDLEGLAAKLERRGIPGEDARRGR